jgi:hypothetical protein
MAKKDTTEGRAARGEVTTQASEASGNPSLPATIASHLADAAEAVDDFAASVAIHFDRVDGGFESPPPIVEGGTNARCNAAWDTPHILQRAMTAITEILFVINAREDKSGPLRRGMDGVWLNAHSSWQCDTPWSSLCDDVIDVGKGIAEKKAEVQRGFQRGDLTFKWASDATVAWAAATVKWLRTRADRLDPRRVDPYRGPREAAPVPKPAGWTRSDLIDQANHDGDVLSATSFDELRKAARIKPGKRGGGGAHRRFSESDLAKLIAEAAKTRRNGKAIVAAWRLLIPGS